MTEQVLNEDKAARKVVSALASKSLIDLVRVALTKVGKQDISAEEVLFTPEGSKARKELVDLIMELLGYQEEPVVSEALHGNFELETFFEMAKDIGLENLRDLEKFLENEAEPGETEWETMLRYRASLGNDFKIKEELAEDKEVCVLCGKHIDGYGNNPAPLADEGKCCDDCNATKVIPARLEASKEPVQEDFKESDSAVEAKEEPKVLPEPDKKLTEERDYEDPEEEEIDRLYHDASEEELRDMGVFDNLSDLDDRDTEKEIRKFGKHDIEFDDDFYGECVHKPFEDDEEEDLMIFDDEPTINY